MTYVDLSLVIFLIFLGATAVTAFVKRAYIVIPFAIGILFILSYNASFILDGVDIDEYQSFYAYIETFSQVIELPSQEFGYRLFMYFGNWLGLTFQQFLFISTFISFAVWFIVLRLLNVRTTVFFAAYYPKYFFEASLNQLRSALIYPGVGLTIYLTLKKNYLLLCSAVLLLSQIHISAILLFAIPLIDKIKLSKVLFLALVITPILFSGAVFTLLEWMSGVSNLRYLGYVSAEFETVDLISLNTARRLVFILISYYVLFSNKINSLDVHILIAKVVLLSWFFYYLFLDIRVLSDRIGNLFGIAELLLFCSLVSLFRLRSSKFAVSTLIVLFIILDYFARL